MEAVYVRHRRIVPGKKVDRRNVVGAAERRREAARGRALSNYAEEIVELAGEMRAAKRRQQDARPYVTGSTVGAVAGKQSAKASAMV